MKKKKIIIGSLVTFLTLGAGLTSVYAFQGGFRLNDEDRSKVMEAIENNDYQAWKNLEESRLTEENFSKIRERHQNKEKMRVAIESGDYNAFIEAIKDSPKQDKFGDKITKDNFNKFVEMHNLKQDGKYEEARVIADELGLNRLGEGKFRHKRGF